MKTRISYEANFKGEAVKLAKETSARKASKDLGIPENTIRNWIRASETRADTPFIGSGRKYISPEDAEKAALLKEVRELVLCNGNNMTDGQNGEKVI